MWSALFGPKMIEVDQITNDALNAILAKLRASKFSFPIDWTFLSLR